MANHDEWRKLRQKLTQQGLEVVLSKGSHYKVYRGKRLLASMSGSSGGGRGLNNTRAQLKRQGVIV